MRHELKCWPGVFQAMVDAVKTFEYRKNDRGFQVGDTLHLREWSPNTCVYTGRALSVDVIYKVDGGQFGIPEGYCIMQTRVASRNAQQAEPAIEICSDCICAYCEHENDDPSHGGCDLTCAAATAETPFKGRRVSTCWVEAQEAQGVADSAILSLLCEISAYFASEPSTRYYREPGIIKRINAAIAQRHDQSRG